MPRLRAQPSPHPLAAVHHPHVRLQLLQGAHDVVQLQVQRVLVRVPARLEYDPGPHLLLRLYPRAQRVHKVRHLVLALRHAHLAVPGDVQAHLHVPLLVAPHLLEMDEVRVPLGLAHGRDREVLLSYLQQVPHDEGPLGALRRERHLLHEQLLLLGLVPPLQQVPVLGHRLPAQLLDAPDGQLGPPRDRHAPALVPVHERVLGPLHLLPRVRVRRARQCRSRPL